MILRDWLRSQDLVCSLKHALGVAIPGSILTFTTDTDAVGYAAGYDFAALSECLDFMMPMIYSSCVKGDEACEYTAGGASMSTVAGLERLMAGYTKGFGVPPSKLAPTLNWFSYDFVCLANASAATFHNQYGCSTVDPPSGVPTPGYGHAQMLASRSGASAPRLDNESGHVFFDYNGAVPPGAPEPRQVWVEGPVSTKLKYDWLAKGGFKGFGIWTAGATAAVDQYWWGGGCNGNTSQPTCPANASLTAKYASEMWGVVSSK